MYGNPYYKPYWVKDDELEHYGILGMKWGIRRYQNADGTLTAAGKKRYAGDTKEQIERSERRKAKVIKGAKIAASVAAVGVASALGISALTSGNRAGVVRLGASAVDQLVRSGMLSNKEASNFMKDSLTREGTRSLDMSNWKNSQNPYYKSGPSKKQQELMAQAVKYELDKKRSK